MLEWLYISSYPQSLKLLMCFLSLGICLFGSVHFSGIIHYMIFCVWLLSLYAFKVHLCCSMDQYRIVCHCMDMPYLVSLFINRWTLDSFQFLHITNKAAMSTCVQVSVWIHIFISLGYISRSGIAGSQGNSEFNFLRHCRTTFQVAAPFPSITENIQGSNFSISSLTFAIVHLFDYSHSGQGK